MTVIQQIKIVFMYLVMITLTLFVFPYQFIASARGAGLCGFQNCDVVWEINRRFDQGVNSKGRALAEGVRVEFEKAMDYLFDSKLSPLLSEFDGVITSQRREIKSMVDDWFLQIDHTINEAAATALEMQQIVISDIRDQLIDKFFREFESIERTIFADLNNLIDKVSCELDGSVNLAAAQLQVILPSLPSLTSVPGLVPALACRLDRYICLCRDGRYLGQPSPDDFGKIYRIQSCEMQRLLNANFENLTTATILEAYVDLTVLTRRTRCAMKTDAAADFYGRELAKWNRRYTIWRFAGAEQ